MIENQDIRPAQVIGPLGEPLTVDDLPSPKTKRWVVRRKAEVVAAVNGGLLTIDEVLERYSLSLEEFAYGRLVGEVELGMRAHNQFQVFTTRATLF